MLKNGLLGVAVFKTANRVFLFSSHDQSTMLITVLLILLSAFETNFAGVGNHRCIFLSMVYQQYCCILGLLILASDE